MYSVYTFPHELNVLPSLLVWPWPLFTLLLSDSNLPQSFNDSFLFFQLTVWGDVFIASADGFKLGLMPKLPEDVTIQSTSLLAPILPLPPILPLTTK